MLTVGMQGKVSLGLDVLEWVHDHSCMAFLSKCGWPPVLNKELGSLHLCSALQLSCRLLYIRALQLPDRRSPDGAWSFAKLHPSMRYVHLIFSRRFLATSSHRRYINSHSHLVLSDWNWFLNWRFRAPPHLLVAFSWHIYQGKDSPIR